MEKNDGFREIWKRSSHATYRRGLSIEASYKGQNLRLVLYRYYIGRLGMQSAERTSFSRKVRWASIDSAASYRMFSLQ
jgi:hypothetical protein